MIFDYSKLLGLMKEQHITQYDLAERLGSTATTLSLKLNNKAPFKQSEIVQISNILGISQDDIDTYFFTMKV